MTPPRRPTVETDPSGLFAAIGTTVGAVLALVAIFVDLPAGLTDASLGVIATIGPLWTALAIRRHAYAPATHHAAVLDAVGGAAADLDGGDGHAG